MASFASLRALSEVVAEGGGGGGVSGQMGGGIAMMVFGFALMAYDTYGYVKQGGDILKLVKTAFTLGKSKCCKGSQKQMATTTITAAETSATVDTPSSAEEGEVAAASSNAADVAAASDAAGDSKV